MNTLETQLAKLEEKQELKLLRKLRVYRQELDECYHDDAFTSTPLWISTRRHALIKLIEEIEEKLEMLK